MPVLTDFLSVPKIPKGEENLSRKYIKELNRQRRVVDNFEKTFDLSVEFRDSIGKQIYNKEKNTILNLFNVTNNIPKEFETSCLGNELNYVGKLNEISKYPFVSVKQLKEIADALSFVILPIQYVNIEEIFNMYEDADVNDVRGWYSKNLYSENIGYAYNCFCNRIKECTEDGLIPHQNFYILAPLSFYDAWQEVKSRRIYPKYFSTKLLQISTMLGMLIPSQRNLYTLVTNTEENIRALKSTMDENFNMLQDEIEKCHKRIDWVEIMLNETNYRIEETKGTLVHLELKQAELERKLHCLLDPIIFSLDSSVNISDPKADSELARVGLCFGPEMPVDFFVENGLTIIKDKRFDEVTQILHPHIQLIKNTDEK